MKNFCIIFLLSIIISVMAFGFLHVSTTPTKGSEGQYLRIHVRADSNEPEAQAVKYVVRDEIVAYLTPLVGNYHTMYEAKEEIEQKLQEISCLATSVLQEKGYSYGAKASVKVEYFPTRIYGEYTLYAGEYTALIIELGEGKGDNWWCVVYPPLCFTSPTGPQVVYASKIWERIQEWKNKQNK